MPITWNFEPGSRFIVLSMAEPYTMDEWRDAVRAILEMPVAGDPVPVLVDRRDSEPLTVQAVDDMVNFIAQHREKYSRRRVSILVNDDANFGMGRMTELRVSVAIPDLSMRTFRSYDDAVRWLTD